MFGCGCFYWNGISSDLLPPNRFSLPAPIARWPQGQGFGSGRINLGELEVLEITNFDVVWRYDLYQDKKKGVSFYRPVEIPDGFHILGHYCQSDDQPLRGYLLVARELSSFEQETDLNCNHDRSPALQTPLDYILEWSSNDESEDNFEGCGYFWLPQPPEGYKAMGYLVTTKPNKPELHDVQCVRADLTDTCETHHLILNASNRFAESTFQVWNTRPRHRGMLGKGIPVGTFFCSSYGNFGEELSVACLRNINPTLHAMPNLDQIHALISHYGPTIYFHPDDIYLPSSVSWFFENGALLYRAGDSIGEAVDASGSNLPVGGTNDGKYWIDLPTGERREKVKCGNLESARLYVHVKPALGGTYTDIAMWVFCPFNGPATLKVGIMNIGLSKVGQHVGDWEHFTLRISNFTGELWRIYFSQHSSGEWIDAFYLEFIEGNKAIVYSSKCGHASFPHPGNYIQGSEKLGIGVRNDAARSNLYVDSSTQYEIIAAEYLGDGAITEPNWLQFMREWGPTVVYDSKTELDKIINRLPVMLRHPVENIFEKLPVELYGEEGPSGPKEKNNWVGDERG